jgi:predicted DCC family thiol-disulfide oxidoreductase YuxK
VCNLCNAVVQFVIRNDPNGCFKLAPLDSEAGRALLAQRGVAPGANSSVVLVDNDGVHVRSDAALRIARRLRAPWPAAVMLWVVPRPIRDGVYDWIAANRYAWYGKRDECLIPTPELAARFL